MTHTRTLSIDIVGRSQQAGMTRVKVAPRSPFAIAWRRMRMGRHGETYKHSATGQGCKEH